MVGDGFDAGGFAVVVGGNGRSLLQTGLAGTKPLEMTRICKYTVSASFYVQAMVCIARMLHKLPV